jgi:hypothetical protein
VDLLELLESVQHLNEVVGVKIHIHPIYAVCSYYLELDWTSCLNICMKKSFVDSLTTEERARLLSGL